jgi:Tfp pilus assembly protein PilV
MRENLPVGTGAERGFTIIEGLVASAILLIVAIGILPLFASSILNNTRGSDSTTASNFGKTSLESWGALPFDNSAILVPGGQTKLEIDDWWKPGNGPINDPSQGWTTTTPPTTTLSTWNRQTTIQQYQSVDVVNGGDLSTPYDGSVPANFTQLKLVTAVVQSSKQGGILGGGEHITFKVLKPF